MNILHALPENFNKAIKKSHTLYVIKRKHTKVILESHLSSNIF